MDGSKTSYCNMKLKLTLLTPPTVFQEHPDVVEARRTVLGGDRRQNRVPRLWYRVFTYAPGYTAHARTKDNYRKRRPEGESTECSGAAHESCGSLQLIRANIPSAAGTGVYSTVTWHKLDTIFFD